MASVELKVPDIGDFKEVEIIEVLVKAGDSVSVEQSLITVESDKASMEIPASIAGTIVEMKVTLGDKVSEGSVIAMIEAAAGSTTAEPARSESKAVSSGAPSSGSATPQHPAATAELKEGSGRDPIAQGSPASVPVGAAHVSPIDETNVVKPHASPAVRMFARELGVDLTKVRGTGPKQRITMDDVRGYVKGVIASAAAPAAAGDGAALGLIPWPKVDFAKFGPIDPKPLSRIKKLSGANLHRNWVMIPAVTYHEDADITDLEAFRVQTNKENEKQGSKITMLAFLIKASVAALKKYPEFNASLDGDDLVLKKYFHIAFAADTPNGLVVPVIRNADQKGIFEIARETAELAALAREGKLKPEQMQGASFTISSLGGIGGTYFAPIINAPEVAILGVSKAAMKPVWDGKEFVPRLICPLSLTADHRVIDGALATRFNVYISQLLADFRRAVL